MTVATGDTECRTVDAGACRMEARGWSSPSPPAPRGRLQISDLLGPTGFKQLQVVLLSGSHDLLSRESHLLSGYDPLGDHFKRISRLITFDIPNLAMITFISGQGLLSGLSLFSWSRANLQRS